jgi:hypothetical protein
MTCLVLEEGLAIDIFRVVTWALCDAAESFLMRWLALPLNSWFPGRALS